MPNFAEIANKKFSEIERPPLAPKGTYRFQITKIPEIDGTVSNGAFTAITLPCKAVEAYDDVDAEELSKFGGFKNVTVPVKFLYDNNDATKGAQTEFRIKTFVAQHCAVEGADDMSVNEGLNKAVNHQFAGTVDWRQDKNAPDIWYAEIRKTAPVRE